MDPLAASFGHKDFDPLAFLRQTLKQSPDMKASIFRLQVLSSEATNNLMHSTKEVVKEVEA